MSLHEGAATGPEDAGSPQRSDAVGAVARPPASSSRVSGRIPARLRRKSMRKPSPSSRRTHSEWLDIEVQLACENEPADLEVLRLTDRACPA
jgi:hypothetical protein